MTADAVRSVIVSGARTPMGRLLGGLADRSAVQLGGVAIAAALERGGVDPDRVQYVAMGHVLQAGAGQLTARQAAVAGGISMAVPAVTVNKVCLSGLDTIVLADQLIRAGSYDLVVAGGMESMSNAPHLLPNSRTGVKYGDAAFVDAMVRDGLWDAFTDAPMGELTERANAAYGLSREQQDAYAARSHQLAARAAKDGHFDAELTSVEIPARKGPPVLIEADEGIRPDTTVEGLSRLGPAFSAEGTITAGSASQISDGACAVVVASREVAERIGSGWIAEIGPHATVAGPDSSLQLQPANAIRQASAAAGIDPRELDLVEINEAFAAVALSSMAALDLDPDRVNACGGAIALGHPLGMSGARIALHLALALRRRGGGTGAAALCGGGGQGEALILRVHADSGDADRLGPGA